MIPSFLSLPKCWDYRRKPLHPASFCTYYICCLRPGAGQGEGVSRRRKAHPCVSRAMGAAEHPLRLNTRGLLVPAEAPACGDWLPCVLKFRCYLPETSPERNSRARAASPLVLLPRGGAEVSGPVMTVDPTFTPALLLSSRASPTPCPKLASGLAGRIMLPLSHQLT